MISPNFSIKINNSDFFKKFIQFLGLIYLGYGVVISLLSACINIDVKFSTSRQTLWEPTVICYGLSNFILLIWSSVILYRNQKYRASKHVANSSYDILIVCFIIFPLFLISFIFLSILLIFDLIYISCKHYENLLVTLGSIFLLFASIFQTYEVSKSFSEQSNLLDFNLLFFLIIGIINCLLFNVSLQHMLIFKDQIKKTSQWHYFAMNSSCDYSGNYQLHKTVKWVTFYLRPILILLSTCTIAYLLQPKKPEIPQVETVESSNSTTNSLENPVINLSFRLPRVSILTCLFFFGLSVLALVALFTLKNLETEKLVFFISSSTLIYFGGIVLTLIFLQEILRWPLYKNRQAKVFDNCLIWVGAIGELFVAISTITKASGHLFNNDSDLILYPQYYNVSLNIIAIFMSILLFIQTAFQTILISLTLDRKWTRHEPESWMEEICPAVGLMGFNISTLLFSVIDLQANVLGTKNSFLSVEIFANCLHSLGENFSIVQRFYSALYFGTMIIYTFN